MTTRLLLLVLGLAALAMGGCSSAQPGASASTSSPPRTRCVVNPNEAGTRPLVFLFCIESP